MNGYQTAFIDGVRQSERRRTDHGIESIDDGGSGTFGPSSREVVRHRTMPFVQQFPNGGLYMSAHQCVAL
jgi:hypothetical protein